MARKIVDVNQFVEGVNRALATEDIPITGIDAASYRLGMATVLEHLLFATNQYHGYAYTPDQYNDMETQILTGSALRPDADPTRRQYITKEN